MQDLFSRRIIGWAMAPYMRSELVAALEMAVRRRRRPQGTIRHSDRGGQFIGLLLGQACHDAGIAQSTGAVGACFDDAVAETFFATNERLLLDAPTGGWTTRAELRSAIFEYIEGFYNPRLHCTLGMRSPVEFEADQAAPDRLARTPARKNLCTTSGCTQLRRQHRPDSTKPGEVDCVPRGFPITAPDAPATGRLEVAQACPSPADWKLRRLEMSRPGFAVRGGSRLA